MGQTQNQQETRMNVRLNKLCGEHMATGNTVTCPACALRDVMRQLEKQLATAQREAADLRTTAKALEAALQAARNGKRKGARA